MRQLGLQSGDAVMVHASLRAIGEIEGGAEGLVRNLLRVLGNPGTLMAYVDFHPTAEIPYFDPPRSPACPEYGVLAEIIRTWPGAKRSQNPGASVAAIGARAEWLCRNHPLNFGYGPKTPFARLIDAEGGVLLLGSDPNNVTLLHHAEHLAKLPGKRIIKRTDKILQDGGICHVQIEEYDTSQPVISAMPGDYFGRIVKAFLKTGLGKTGKVGNADCALLPADALVRFAVAMMENEFGAANSRK
ncbi:MAG: aminoglycoside 3-N-acetyltransferase [Calditrichaeota bacterium]|nr:aminoglycoside 3-N-acetyltransferase [Calditrichota bacterium]